MNKVKTLICVLVGLGVIALAIVLATNGTGQSGSAVSGKVRVVAAENVWGSLVSQIGGSKVQVTSIVTDPNADPHEYESDTASARAVTAANYVVLNGAGYDAWANKLLSASPSPNRKVLTVADLLGKKSGDNPHFWYSPAYVNRVIVQMERDLAGLDPRDAGYFMQQLQAVQRSLAGYQNHIAAIKKQYGGTEVAATEDVFAYLAQAAGLNLVSPPAFIEAVGEGNDPPASSVATFQQQLQSGQVKVLVYNEQTVTPLTTNMKKLAADNSIPIVGVTEIIQPPGTTFQAWMNTELINLEDALNGQAAAR